jgi:hypothetical protein
MRLRQRHVAQSNFGGEATIDTQETFKISLRATEIGAEHVAGTTT